MNKRCNRQNHIWTVESFSDVLAPSLDLILGRRCLCGRKVIVEQNPDEPPAQLFRIVHVNSDIARVFAEANPALKTW